MICPVTNLTKDLVNIPTISPNDAGCQRIISNRLMNIGFAIKNIDYHNISNMWAYRGNGKTFVFAGHTDVVPAGDIKKWKFHPFKAVISDGKLFGRGSSDMKGALAAMVIAVERFIKRFPNYKGRIGFILTSDEEGEAINGTSRIINELLKQSENVDYCLIGEPSSRKYIGDTIKNGRRGSLSIILTISGKQRHTAYSKSKDNLIHTILPFINHLINISWPTQNKLFSKNTIQVTSIHTNKINNNFSLTPESAFINLNFRFGDLYDISIIYDKIKKMSEMFNLRCSIITKQISIPFFNDALNFKKIVSNAIMYYTRRYPVISTDGGTSDGRFIQRISKEIIELGLTNVSIHQTNECVKISDLRLLTCIYQKILEYVFCKKKI